MIVYNNRYRGPIEYDKFILNILQFSNETNLILVNEFYESKSQSTLKAFKENIDDLFQKQLNQSEQLFLKLTNFEEV